MLHSCLRQSVVDLIHLGQHGGDVMECLRLDYSGRCLELVEGKNIGISLHLYLALP